MKTTSLGPRFLVSYFEPFGGATFNCSSLVGQVVIEQNLESFEVVQLPVSFSKAWPTLLNRIQTTPKLDGIIACGEAGERKHISLERIAINWQQASIQDNDGNQPGGSKISPDGPDGIFCSLDLSALEGQLPPHAPMPIKISNSAGTFVCNQLMYQLLDWAKDHSLGAGFIHVPALRPESTDFANQQQALKDSLGLIFTQLNNGLP